jgi:DNA-binding NarL/FixJ family response regulator
MVREGLKALINQIDDFEIVAEFADGQSWLNHLNEVQTDIILLDINMPGMDGITAMKKALTHIPHLKIIILSMHTDINYYQDAVTNGAKGFVLKQASVNDLERGITKVVNGGTFFSEELLHKVLINLSSTSSQQSERKSIAGTLSKQERSLLEHLCKGFTNHQIAEAMYLSVKTIERHKTRLMRKTNTTNTAGLIVWAIKNDIVKI